MAKKAAKKKSGAWHRRQASRGKKTRQKDKTKKVPWWL